MNRIISLIALLGLACVVAGCSSPTRKTYRLQLGMNPDEVREEMGKPYSVRSAKKFENEETTMIWEYWPAFFATNPAKIHCAFENGELVQWGLPGDYGTGSEKKVTEYKEQKSR